MSKLTTVTLNYLPAICDDGKLHEIKPKQETVEVKIEKDFVRLSFGGGVIDMHQDAIKTIYAQVMEFENSKS